LAPTFGVSVVPWTAVIAAVLLGIALGNAWGGRRSGGDGGRLLLGLLLLLAAVAILTPIFRGNLPDLLHASAGMVLGSLASAGVLLLPASFLLGATGPILVRIGTVDLASVGSTSGGINAAGAMGAIAGTLLSGFVLIPLLPLPQILLTTGAALTAAAVSVAVLERVPAGPSRRERPRREAGGIPAGEALP
ncbi:MAG TPA: fused MFS/spermidine synthase, partial [Longimicrobiaceae bacterium]|nr:fused MFS/spermidine synthase [Longimicrobiaceae bacterium]